MDSKDERMNTDSIFSYIFYPITLVLNFLEAYGWYLLGAGIVATYLERKLRPRYNKWKEAREDAEYHKNPDIALARMEAVQRARDRQQHLLEQASQRALELQKEREEKKRAETAECLKKYGAAAGGGRRLGAEGEGEGEGAGADGYLPLSGGAGASSYRPPKKSKCGGGGCGR